MTSQQSLVSWTKHVSADTIMGFAVLGIAATIGGIGYLVLKKF